jgi:Cu(I)/Ag(I) efflux system membrane protein CusA/SilA
MVGGMISATLLTLIVIPAVYLLWKQFRLPH